MREIPLIGRPFKEHSPESFKAYVESLYRRPAGSTPVDGVKIVFGEKVTQVRITREKREVTKKELSKLAEFYERTEQELNELFKKRKVEIL